MKLKEKIQIYFRNRRINSIKKSISRVSLHLYFDGWTGKDCIEELEYLHEELKFYETTRQ